MRRVDVIGKRASIALIGRGRNQHAPRLCLPLLQKGLHRHAFLKMCLPLVQDGLQDRLKALSKAVWMRTSVMPMQDCVGLIHQLATALEHLEMVLKHHCHAFHRCVHVHYNVFAQDRVGLIHQLATLPEHPESVPINRLVAIKGTPLGDTGIEPPSGLDLVRCIATARVVMPATVVRLSAGRLNLSIADQAMAFMAGANSIFDGDKLLTTANNDR
ncbi:hypothetical protein DUNSADRAFT_9047 [Dunaliella salina]|uniref:Biotin and thiamin synthesis-associated domain-containing protein n=1 Tax=Dunaliella salina TaxID=3046 RepID=A0ABQ7GI60_DUNSA|nr:hypothetical protein DUNSADRAFT_9047 [Dunaliella salina]|eukprot:KAF5834304.1 hypothetical protein DUNSADRAFT_9047 [Dunaliella salina]